MPSTRRYVPQPVRLLILLVYLGLVVVMSRLLFGHWVPPADERGLWFYSAVLALLLGSLLVTPWFTKPTDAISYAVAALVVLLGAAPFGGEWGLLSQAAWATASTYMIAVLCTALGAIALRSQSGWIGERAEHLFRVTGYLGKPRLLFSVLFVSVLLAYNLADRPAFFTLIAAWGIFVLVRPLERLAGLVRQWPYRLTGGTHPTRAGTVVGHQSPGIILIQEDPQFTVKYGDVLAVRSEAGEPCRAMALDHIGFSAGRWLRALRISPVSSYGGPAVASGEAFLLEQTEYDDMDAASLSRMRDSLVGIVAPGTDIARLKIDLARNDLPLCQGAILEAHVGSTAVLYQVIDGITREDVLSAKNTRGFVEAGARKIGSWNQERQAFESVPWVPNPNEPTYLVSEVETEVDSACIGHFPNTTYGVQVDPDKLVTHNAAILGILGVGKTFLALELVERMIRAGIKVICLDLTNQYATKLQRFLAPDAEEKLTQELNTAGRSGKTNYSKIVEEGGSTAKTTEILRQHVRQFLDPKVSGSLRVINPARIEAWRQDSRQYPDGKAAMAALTACEVTRLITECALEALQEQGVSTSARCCLIYEEAHSLIPEWNAVASEGDRAATNGTAKAILQGRKFGLGCLVITQRTANVTKSILNQCNTVFALRVFDATGMEFLSNYIGQDYSNVLSSLEDRQAVVFGRASSCRDPVLIRLNDRTRFLDAFRANAAGETNTKEAT